ncbi:hypothetical protein BCV69DRAFT_282200 [Microstroma glucosiphilum]|uniref:Uncharacterized protein n=1 Tax=Pseudomicrostroma glucosiphilum TaxID=1684307 RepID=A0A316UEF1_9BASI|nr:hypothetical protein BCV69DRAFT_282200 [Pseudomicrostroma glucosiphilum]PWN21475.1 hypothetical protein BCV69DRAFT_282200 [Pseudomicrostroma glucosiphilum]
MQLYSTPFALLSLAFVLLLGIPKPTYASSSKYMARSHPRHHVANRMVKLALRTDTSANEEFARKTLSGLGEIHRGRATWFEPGE